jgi:hypothetical protein
VWSAFALPGAVPTTHLIAGSPGTELIWLGYLPGMAKDHGSSIKNDKQYEGLKKKGMSKSRAAAISNSEGASSRGGKKSGSGGSSKSNASQGGTTQQKKAAGRKGGKASAGKS